MNNMFNPYMSFPQTYPQFPQGEQKQPIQNIFTNQAPITNSNSEFFMARFLKPNEDINNIYINGKTAFIDMQNKKLMIKEPQKEITEQYEIVIPKDEKDLKIEEQNLQINNLQEQINQLKEMIENDKANGLIPTSDESTETNGNAKKFRSK